MSETDTETPETVIKYLKYVGEGSALIGIPARDLTLNEVAIDGLNIEYLVNTGLYEIVREEPDGDRTRP